MLIWSQVRRSLARGWSGIGKTFENTPKRYGLVLGESVDCFYVPAITGKILDNGTNCLIHWTGKTLNNTVERNRKVHSKYIENHCKLISKKTLLSPLEVRKKYNGLKMHWTQFVYLEN